MQEEKGQLLKSLTIPFWARSSDVTGYYQALKVKMIWLVSVVCFWCLECMQVILKALLIY